MSYILARTHYKLSEFQTPAIPSAKTRDAPRKCEASPFSFTSARFQNGKSCYGHTDTALSSYFSPPPHPVKLPPRPAETPSIARKNSPDSP